MKSRMLQGSLSAVAKSTPSFPRFQPQSEVLRVSFHGKLCSGAAKFSSGIVPIGLASTFRASGSGVSSAGKSLVGRSRPQVVMLSSGDGDDHHNDSNLAVNEAWWKFCGEEFIQGDFGSYSLLATLLLGFGVSCVMNVGDAEAATSHWQNGSVNVDMRALALGPEGPLVEEFWDNMRRYGLYFLTVLTGGLYSLVKPIIDGVKNPVTAVLIVIIVTGSIYLVGLTVSFMLGINEFHYDYAG